VVEAARQFMPLGTILLLIGGILSTMSALNATTYSSTRVSFAMGRDRNLPDAFADVHPETRTPFKALFFSGIVILGMAVAIPIEDVATAADIMFLLLFMQVNIAVITLRKKYGDRLQYGFLMPFFPYIPIVVIVFKLGLALFMFNYSPIAWYFALAWIGIGTVLYYLYARPRGHAGTRSPTISEAKLLPEPVDPEQYRVVLAIANPESLDGLLQPALNAARQHDGAITLLNVITVPDQLPLSAGREYINRSERLRQRALELLEHEDVPIEVEIRISHRLTRTIIEAVEEKTANLLIMGWKGGSSQPGSMLGRNIDDVIHRVNCKVLVVQQALHEKPNRIIIPIQDPQQVRFSLEGIGYVTGAPVVEKVITHVFPIDSPEDVREAFLDQVRREVKQFEKRFPKTEGSIKVEGIQANDPVQAIVNAAKDYDYMVIGATRDGWLKRRFFDSTPMLLAERVGIPVAVTRPRTNPFSFGIRQILNYIWGGYLDIDPRSQRELVDLGLLLPAEEAKPFDPTTAINKAAIVVLGLLAVGSTIAMYVGGGGMLTWVGAVVFILVLWIFTWMTIRPSPHEMMAPPEDM
jgi:nucleotide-binding universal stress UspA family protein